MMTMVEGRVAQEDIETQPHKDEFLEADNNNGSLAEQGVTRRKRKRRTRSR